MCAQDSSSEFHHVAQELIAAMGDSPGGSWIHVWRWLAGNEPYCRLLQQAVDDDLRWQGLPANWTMAVAHLAMLGLARRLGDSRFDKPLPEPVADWLMQLTRSAGQDAVRSLLSCQPRCCAVVDEIQKPCNQSRQHTFVRFCSLADRFHEPFRTALLLVARKHTLKEASAELRLSLAQTRRVARFERRILAALRADRE
ncbi:MAG: hypothetical protein WD847_01405 [Pirellulales bacterium]